MSAKDQLFKKGRKIIYLKGLGVGNGYLLLTLQPPDSGPTDNVGKARIKAKYNPDAVPASTPEIDFSNADSIQKAMKAHPDVATLLFLSLPALGDIAESDAAKEAAKLQQQLEAAEQEAKKVKTEAEAAKKQAEEALAKAEAGKQTAEQSLADAIAKLGVKEEELADTKAALKEANADVAKKDKEIARLEAELARPAASASTAEAETKEEAAAEFAAPAAAAEKPAGAKPAAEPAAAEADGQLLKKLQAGLEVANKALHQSDLSHEKLKADVTVMQNNIEGVDDQIKNAKNELTTRAATAETDTLSASPTAEKDGGAAAGGTSDGESGGSDSQTSSLTFQLDTSYTEGINEINMVWAFYDGEWTRGEAFSTSDGKYSIWLLSDRQPFKRKQNGENYIVIKVPESNVLPYKDRSSLTGWAKQHTELGLSGNSKSAEILTAIKETRESGGMASKGTVAEPPKTWKEPTEKPADGTKVRMKESRKEGKFVSSGSWVYVKNDNDETIYKINGWTNIKSQIEVESQ